MATQISFSRIESFDMCPFKYKLSYIDKVDILETGDVPSNALTVGSAMHKGIECGVEAGLKEYRKDRYSINDLSLDEEFKLEQLIEKARAMLPEGELEFEHELNFPNFKGFIDLVVKKPNGNIALFDFKYSNNVDKYRESAQIHLYKYFYQLENPDAVIDELGYIFIPKTSIRQKKTETLFDFKSRLRDEVLKSEITFETVDYNERKVTTFFSDAVHVLSVELDGGPFEKNQGSLCYFCKFKDFCENGSDIFMLPKNEKRTIDLASKVKIFVYGKPYTGKTYFANTFPSPLFFNTDGNVNSFDSPVIVLKDSTTKEATPTGRSKLVTKTAWSLFEESVDELALGNHDFKTVVVDLIDDVYEACRLHMYKELGIQHESDDAFKAWQQIRTRFFTVIKKLTTLDLNVVFIAHEECSRDLTKPSGEKITYIGPVLTEKVANKLAGTVDATARIVFDNKAHQLVFDANTFGGNRINIPSVTIDATYNDLVNLYHTYGVNQKAAAPVEVAKESTPEVAPEVATEPAPELKAEAPKRAPRVKPRRSSLEVVAVDEDEIAF